MVLWNIEKKLAQAEEKIVGGIVAVVVWTKWVVKNEGAPIIFDKNSQYFVLKIELLLRCLTWNGSGTFRTCSLVGSVWAIQGIKIFVHRMMTNLIGSTVCYYHITYAFSCLNVKELLAQNRCHIWSLHDGNWIQTQNHLVPKWTQLDHLACLAKWLSVRLGTTWLWVWILLIGLPWYVVWNIQHLWHEVEWVSDVIGKLMKNMTKIVLTWGSSWLGRN